MQLSSTKKRLQSFGGQIFHFDQLEFKNWDDLNLSWKKIAQNLNMLSHSVHPHFFRESVRGHSTTTLTSLGR